MSVWMQQNKKNTSLSQVNLVLENSFESKQKLSSLDTTHNWTPETICRASQCLLLCMLPKIQKSKASKYACSRWHHQYHQKTWNKNELYVIKDISSQWYFATDQVPMFVDCFWGLLNFGRSTCGSKTNPSRHSMRQHHAVEIFPDRRTLGMIHSRTLKQLGHRVEDLRYKGAFVYPPRTESRI